MVVRKSVATRVILVDTKLDFMLVMIHLFRINFCSAWICLLIDAIKATIDFRTSALVTVPLALLISYASATFP